MWVGVWCLTRPALVTRGNALSRVHSTTWGESTVPVTMAIARRGNSCLSFQRHNPPTRGNTLCILTSFLVELRGEFPFAHLIMSSYILEELPFHHTTSSYILGEFPSQYLPASCGSLEACHVWVVHVRM